MKHITDRITEKARDIYGNTAAFKFSQKKLESYLADITFNKADAYQEVKLACEYALWISDFETVTRLSRMAKNLQPEYRKWLKLTAA